MTEETIFTKLKRHGHSVFRMETRNLAPLAGGVGFTVIEELNSVIDGRTARWRRCG